MSSTGTVYEREMDISYGSERVMIELINEISDNRPWRNNFKYIPSSIAGPGVELDLSTSYYPGCFCEQGCFSDEKCECLTRYGQVYDSKHCLLATKGEQGYCQPLFECNSRCKCPMTCPNRVVQKGLNIKLQVFRTASKGWGVKALEHIDQKQFVCEYAGEIITYKEAKKRAQGLSGVSGQYIIVLREHQARNQVLRTHIDSQLRGNVARFINHSCSPNLFMTAVRVNSIIPRLALFAATDIEEGEELCFDYAGNGYEYTWDGQSKNEVSEFTDDKNQKTRCLCETSNCRAYLPFDSKLFCAEGDF